MNERLGVLGGAFDPLHYGHLILAEQAHGQLNLDRVFFVPSFQPPANHKSIVTPFRQRCEMLDLVLGDFSHFQVSRLEEELESPTYTVRMLETFKSQWPDTSIFFLMGSDSVQHLDSWYHPEKLRELAELAVARRPGHEQCETEHGVHWIDMPLIEISASDLRARVRDGRSLRFLVPDPVIDYIAHHGLYRI